jgi:pyruvate dehydrogenase E2 component (dihydrolipoamide acetyltransferase)
MGLLEFKLPDIGEGIAEAEVVSWSVTVGQQVEEDQDLVEIMTDKATVRIGAPKAGVIIQLGCEAGQRLRVGSTLAVIEVAHEERVKAVAPHPAKVEPPQRQPVALAQPLATPATRRLARELGVDLLVANGSGPGQRINDDDVRRAARLKLAGTDRPVAPPKQSERRVPFRGVQRQMADRMALATQKAAHFTFVEEVEVDRLRDLIASLSPVAERAGLKLYYLPFVIRAVASALTRHQLINATLDEASSELVYRDQVHVGVATATPDGLVVPVIRNAHQKSVLSIAKEVKQLAERARARRLEPSETSGSTFTVSSLGKRGGLLATPILNHPELGVMGVHRVKERPVVRSGAIVAAPVMCISLSFDHRVIDGHTGAAFAYEVLELLEAPDRLLFDSGG